MFSKVFSVKSIHLLEKRMLWLNGLPILPTLHGWKVRNDIHNICTSCRDAWIIFMEIILLLFQFPVLATVHAFRGILSFSSSFDTAEFPDASFPVLLRKQTVVCAFLLDPFYIASCLLCEQLCDVRSHALVVVNGSFYASDPDEVIYDDVPRENSDSNTGLYINPTFHKFSIFVPVCSFKPVSTAHFYFYCPNFFCQKLGY